MVGLNFLKLFFLQMLSFNKVGFDSKLQTDPVIFKVRRYFIHVLRKASTVSLTYLIYIYIHMCK